MKRLCILIVLLLSLQAQSAFDNTIPGDNDDWDDAASDIRANWDALELILGIDVNGIGSAMVYRQAAAPSVKPDGATALDSDDDGRLWTDSDTGKVYVYIDGTGGDSGWRDIVTVFTPEQFGAVGDGSTDDQPAFQLALDALSTAGGGVLLMSEKTYVLNTDTGADGDYLDVPANVMILGSGYGTVIEPTIKNNQDIFFMNGKNNVVLRDFRVDGSGSTWNASGPARGPISFRQCLRGRVENIWIENWQGTGIMLDSCDQIIVENCYIYRPYEHGIYVSGTHATANLGGNIIRNNIIIEAGYSSSTSHLGIKIANTALNVLVDGNHILDSTDVSIAVESSAADIQITNNRIENSDQACVRLVSGVGDSVTINGNEFIDCAVDAVLLQGGQEHRIINNRFRLLNKWAIIATVLNNSVISNNYLDGSYGTAYGFDLGTTTESDDNVIMNNMFYSIAGTGIRFTDTDCSGNYVFNNVGATYSGLPVAGAAVIVPKFLYGSATWNPDNITDGSEDAETVTVTGAALEDYAIASFSLDVSDLQLTADVTATNTVTCVLSNSTGSAVNLLEGTVSVIVIPDHH